MIISISLNRYIKCKIWVNETARLPFNNAENVIEKDIPSIIKKTTGIVQMAPE